MMNRFEGPGGREAGVRYLDGDFQVTSPGAFVRCAVTHESIPLDELRYWSVALQEAYISPEAVLQRLHPDRAQHAARGRRSTVLESGLSGQSAKALRRPIFPVTM